MIIKTFNVICIKGENVFFKLSKSTHEKLNVFLSFVKLKKRELTSFPNDLLNYKY